MVQELGRTKRVKSTPHRSMSTVSLKTFHNVAHADLGNTGCITFRVEFVEVDAVWRIEFALRVIDGKLHCVDLDATDVCSDKRCNAASGSRVEELDHSESVIK